MTIEDIKKLWKEENRKLDEIVFSYDDYQLQKGRVEGVILVLKLAGEWNERLGVPK